jgi:class 3 adenylate cyclase
VPVCPSCGVESPDGFRFCGACGQALPEAGALGAADERRTITVLFADLVGFTSLADRLDPEDVRRLLEPFHARLRWSVEHLGGTVEKFIGDAVMAVFGAPVAHEDDPERAVRAALRIRDAIAELAESTEGAKLALRIGVSTGEALFKPEVLPGEGERIVADFVNVASRLQAAAPVNGILVGEATYLATARAIEYQAFEPVRARGKAEPVLAWEAVGARSRVGADPRERGRAPLVGRTDEVLLLCDAFARARREHSAQLVTLVGPPGIGKSRLVLELSSVVEDDPELVSWRRGGCLPYGEGVTFWPLSEMVKAQAGILETDSPGEVERALRREVSDLFPNEDEAHWVEMHLGPLVGLARPGGDRSDNAEDFAAWRRFFEAIAEQSPTVLLFEDLHWADEGLLDFVDYLVEWASAVPMLVVCTARPELLVRRPSWGGGKLNAVTVSLSPLSDEETSLLLTELLEQAVLPPDLTSALLARAGGNPLYAEEFVRMIAEREADAASDDPPVPASVQGIIAARLDTLDPEEKAVLQDAAVVGRVFWLGAISSLSGLARWRLDELFRSLERKQFVRRQRPSTVERESEYAFRHLLLRDVAYGRIPRSSRAEKHRQAAEWVESLGRQEDHAETCAYHYRQALEYARASGVSTAALEERARAALVDAGDRAAGLKGFAAARRFFEEALDLWPTDDPDRAGIAFRIAKAAYFTDDAGPEMLVEARDGLLAAGDPAAAAEAEIMLGRLAFREGRGGESALHYQSARELLTGTPPSPSKAIVLSATARGLLVAARAEEALAVASEAAAMADELDLDDVRALTTMTIGDARVQLGDLGGLADFERGIELAVEAGSPEAVSGTINLADTVMDLGEPSRAVELRELARSAAERLGDARSLRWLRAERSGELYWLGRWDEALELADAFVAESAGGSRHYMEAYCRLVRGRIRLARGETAAALEDAARAVELGREALDPQALYPTLGFRARALAAAGKSGEASASAAELLERVREQGSAPLAYLWIVDLAVTLVSLGRGHELADALPPGTAPTPWVTAGLAIARGEADAAAETLAAIGAKPDEALARMCAATSLAASERADEASAQLERARAFYRSVGAEAALAGSNRVSARAR